MTAREESLIAREMLLKPELLGRRLKERRWAEVAALVRYCLQDVPKSLAMSDPALYRALREGVTRFYMRGGGGLSLEKLEALAAQQRMTE